jgi:hypothetical protein
MLEQESFWDSESFVVITDKTKPAMQLTIDELASRGKKIYVVDMSDKPDVGTIQSVSELPSGIDSAVIGLTKTDPADTIEELEKKGLKRFWIHWRTETPELKRRCKESQVQCIIGRCPMMYLGRGLSIHSMHRGVARLFGKY